MRYPIWSRSPAATLMTNEATKWVPGGYYGYYWDVNSLLVVHTDA